MPYYLSKPIVIAPYDPQWPIQYETERQRLAPTVAPIAVQIEHIGSTSVPGLTSKEIVDISVSVQALENTDSIITALSELAYEDAKINPLFQRCMFSRGPWNEAGSLHLHVTVHGSDIWAKPILLRMAETWMAIKRERGNASPR